MSSKRPFQKLETATLGSKIDCTMNTSFENENRESILTAFFFFFTKYIFLRWTDNIQYTEHVGCWRITMSFLLTKCDVICKNPPHGEI